MFSDMIEDLINKHCVWLGVDRDAFINTAIVTLVARMSQLRKLQRDGYSYIGEDMPEFATGDNGEPLAGDELLSFLLSVYNCDIGTEGSLRGEVALAAKKAKERMKIQNRYEN